jgi:8-oxo-dGTP pyrophosphatase MutT (NUDIX family)
MNMPDVVVPRPAATVIVLRDGADGPEVFMVRRHEKAVFMGGAYVFPGGAVDASDRESIDPCWVDGRDHAVRQLPALPPEEAVALHVAAVRELFEEAGVLVARHAGGPMLRPADAAARARVAAHRLDVHDGTRLLRQILSDEALRIAADALVLSAHWVTPPIDVRRFDTRFFITRLPDGQVASHDARETTESLWIAPARAIEAAERDHIVLPTPTWITLRELAEFDSVEQILTWAGSRTVTRREPGFIRTADSRMLIMPHADFADRWGSAETRFVWDHDRWRPVADAD